MLSHLRVILRGTKMCAVGPDSPDRGKSAASTSSKVFCGVSPPGIVRLPGFFAEITFPTNQSFHVPCACGAYIVDQAGGGGGRGPC